MQPIIPKNLNPLALGVLNALTQHSESNSIILGGYFALKHYLDYRDTKDIDAWWVQGLWEPDQKRLFNDFKKLIEDFAYSQNMEIRERKTRNMQSMLKYMQTAKQFFSFQIANREIQLCEPLTSPYPPILIETLESSLASRITTFIY